MTFLDAIMDGRKCLRPTEQTDDKHGPAMLVCGEAIEGTTRYCPECEKRLLIPVKPMIGKAKSKAA